MNEVKSSFPQKLKTAAGDGIICRPGNCNKEGFPSVGIDGNYYAI